MGLKWFFFSFFLSSPTPPFEANFSAPYSFNVKKIKYWISALVKLLWDLCISLVKLPANFVILLCFNKQGAILFLKYLVLLDYDYSDPAYSQGASLPQCLCLHLCQNRTVLRTADCKAMNQEMQRHTEQTERQWQGEHGNMPNSEWGFGLLEIRTKDIQFLQFPAQTTKYLSLGNGLIGHCDSFANDRPGLVRTEIQVSGH